MIKTNKTIEVGVINGKFKVIVCWGSDEYLNKQGLKYKYNNGEVVNVKGDEKAACYYNSKCHPLIVLSGYPRKPEDIAYLCHEVIHAVNNSFNYIGEKSHDEIFCYTVDNIILEVLKQGKDERKHRNPRTKGKSKKGTQKRK